MGIGETGDFIAEHDKCGRAKKSRNEMVQNHFLVAALFSSIRNATIHLVMGSPLFVQTTTHPFLPHQHQAIMPGHIAVLLSAQHLVASHVLAVIQGPYGLSYPRRPSILYRLYS